MAVDVEVRTTIDKPRTEVAAFVMDARNDTSWIGGISSSRIVDAEEVKEGVRVERVAHFLGRRIEYVNEVTAYDPPSLLDMRSVKAPFPMRITYTFEEHAKGTEVRVRIRGDASGFYSLAGPLLSAMVKRSVGRDLKKLKDILGS